jgi:AcrR family transcriptional regulator
MVSQVRSAATRRKILDAAIDVFNEVGYTAASRGEIIERAGMTKGALYHHFDSMESLASAIIEEGSGKVLGAFATMCESASPALENIIHGVFVAADLLASDKVARAAAQLTVALAGFNAAAAQVYTNWLAAIAAAARQAIAEGDLRTDLDPDTVSESVVAAMFGTLLLSKATSSSDPCARLSRTWELLLPSIATDVSLPYFREFLAREALRRTRTEADA